MTHSYKPLVSVVIPVYNSSVTIVRALNSVINQTYKNIEIIVVDDGSSDSSLDLIYDFFERTPISHVVLIQSNKGPSAARTRNCALFVAKGSYVAFLDSDDEWLNHKIEKQLICFINDEELVLLGTNGKSGKQKIKMISFYKLLFKNYFLTSSVMIKMNNLNIKFDENMSFSEDYKLWLHIAYKNKSAVLNEYLVIYAENNTNIFNRVSLSAQMWKMQCGVFNTYRFLYKNNYISFFSCVCVYFLSSLKYIYRVLRK